MARFLRFLEISAEERRLFLSAVAMMTMVRIALLFVSAPRVAHVLGSLAGRKRSAPAAGITAARAARRIEQAARYCPVPVTCLVQALVSKTLMTRRGYSGTVRIGVLKSGEKLEAHAWLECGGELLIGNPTPQGKQFVRLDGAERLGG